MDIRAVGIDHIVLRVLDVERALAFYMGELGLEGVRVAEWRAGEVFFPSVRVSSTFIIDLFPSGRDADARSEMVEPDLAALMARNLDHFCLVVDAVDLDAVATSGRFDVVGGPSALFGAQGEGVGLYVRDPDGNVIELRHYGPDPV